MVVHSVVWLRTSSEQSCWPSYSKASCSKPVMFKVIKGSSIDKKVYWPVHAPRDLEVRSSWYFVCLLVIGLLVFRSSSD